MCLSEAVENIVSLSVLAIVIGLSYLMEKCWKCSKEFGRIWSNPRMTGQGDPSSASTASLAASWSRKESSSNDSVEEAPKIYNLEEVKQTKWPR